MLKIKVKQNMLAGQEAKNPFVNPLNLSHICVLFGTKPEVFKYPAMMEDFPLISVDNAESDLALLRSDFTDKLDSRG
jgi:hypothetical protein